MDPELRMPSKTVEATLNTLESHGYMKICELIDKGEYEEAGKVAEVLEKVGII